MDVLVLGSGPTGLLAGAALAERGHRVTSVDRDPGPAPDGSWPRRGVMQFAHAHGFRPQVAGVLARRWPAGLAAWRTAGAEPLTMPTPDGGEVTFGYRSRRSTFERALRVAAVGTPGLTLRRGHIDGLLTDHGAVIGAVVEGSPVRADLVIDASGRSSRIDRRTRTEIEGLCGMAYVDRTYQLRTGAEPPPLDNPLAGVREYDGYQVLIFRHEAGHFSTLIVRPTADHDLKILHQVAAYEAACRTIPLLAEWTDPGMSVPTSPVMVGGALRNTYVPQRRLPGLVTVGDATATTTPTRGRGIAMAYLQVDALLDLLDEGRDPRSVVEPFDTWCEMHIRPWVEDHIAIDTEAVARWQGADIDLDRTLTSHAVCLAAQVDPRIDGIAQPFYAMTALPACLAAAEPLARAVYETGWRPPLPEGPSRDELVAITTRAA